jgi:DNA-binding XRE family transcriptional regulator
MSKAERAIRNSAAVFDALSAPVLEHPERFAPVKVARIRQGITGAELADFAGVSARTIWRAEAGHPIGRQSEARIALALGRQREDLFA